MSDPVVLAVDEDVDALRDVEETLRDRYGSHYRVECMRSPFEARARLQALADAHEDVAIVLAGQWLDGMTGSDLLDDARRLHPHSKRALVIHWGQWGDPATGEAIFDAIARARIDHYVIRPSQPPDELFHAAIGGMLLEWAESQRMSPHTIHVIGRSWDGRAYELRQLLGRCAMPHAFSLADSPTGREYVEQVGDDGAFPLVIFPDGRVLRDPTNSELVEASGSPIDPPDTEFDLVIVGAGPAGLSAAVYGASEGFDTLVVDSGGIGGQATSSSLIRNYLGFPRGVSGRRLAQSAYEQAWVFGARFAFMQFVTMLGRDRDGLWLDLSESGRIRSRAVLLATGAEYQRIEIAELEALNGAGVFYGGSASEASRMAGREVYVVGGANSAGQAALHLAQYAAHVTLVVRADSLEPGMSRYLVQQVEATPRLDVRVATEIVGGAGAARLEHLVLRDRRTAVEETVPADGRFVMIGARPHTGWLPDIVTRDEQGFLLTGADVLATGTWPLERAPLSLETSVPGVFAAGDARRAAVRRVASAVGEGSVAVQQLHRLFELDGLHPRGRVKTVAR
ncbi:MAG TPA: FAD-dependent oxidoreductase [Acidimicrobiia bacterium]|nr:FAD-dependent oxidoreductase [Acidimicrobiia bacterium]